ncbi:MAG: protein-glutamate O-methyltransferase [Thermodesulfovibrionales bacterium]|nr:protein-glutamate O-methyltransferase [Thermodesulfovibrionales bacterium]
MIEDTPQDDEAASGREQAGAADTSDHDKDTASAPEDRDAQAGGDEPKGKKPSKKVKKPSGKMKLRGIFAERLSDELFEKMSAFVNNELGIKMPDRKKVMLEARLRKRLRALGMKNFEEYAEYVFSPGGLDNEVVHLLDVVTTNKTDFFREPRHYDLLTETVLPELLKRKPKGEPLKIWSAACSSGEEPYTLAIVMSEFARANDCPPFSILGTDVSTHVLYMGLDAIYKEKTISDVPEGIKKKYFLRSKDHNKPVVRLTKNIRDLVSFRRLNFMEPAYDIDKDFDIVFCRNVMIYFDRPTQEVVVNRLCRHIRPEGYLIMGHSETLMGIRAPLKQMVSTVYSRLPGDVPSGKIAPMRMRRPRKEQDRQE